MADVETQFKAALDVIQSLPKNGKILLLQSTIFDALVG